MTDEDERIEEQTPEETAPEPDGRDEELEQLRADLETARGQVTRLEHERYLLQRGVPEEDLDYYLFKVEKMESAQDDFKKAARDYLKAHPIKRTAVSSSAELSESRKSKPQSASELMNQLLRNR